ncbi:hypothetical protein HF1_09690 [Mycoplasma haemofelis str. Langford 1]|uniref:Uncharacterized protein n=1 Tax=Mycoplasma haemofelis (strain Langford 1) TaxID=941640 RepID=E8ZIK6_MYCHL|nr:hypothetical protein [Mycoplasma haemofelis]CBY92977.1 hypothetical protein HF1_09690 [Mycoplasma haemofelis str. Langford 1]
MNLVKMGAVSAASVGGVAGTVALAKNIGSTPVKKVKSVADKLREEKFVLISSEQEWSAMLTKYNGKKGEAGARFDDVNVEAAVESLKSSCGKALSEDSSTSQNYSKARRWCTVVKTLETHLTANALTLLNVKGTGDEDKDHWEKLQTSYEKLGSNAIAGLTFSEPDKWKALRTKCKEISEKETVESDFDTLFNNLKSWCTRQEADKLVKQ